MRGWVRRATILQPRSTSPPNLPDARKREVKLHHSLKSPACSCVSITLPASLPAHVQKNIAFAGLMNSVHSVRYGCDFADVLCRFSSRVSCRGPDDLGQIFNLFSKLGSSISVEEL